MVPKQLRRLETSLLLLRKVDNAVARVGAEAGWAAGPVTEVPACDNPRSLSSRWSQSMVGLIYDKSVVGFQAIEAPTGLAVSSRS